MEGGAPSTWLAWVDRQQLGLQLCPRADMFVRSFSEGRTKTTSCIHTRMSMNPEITPTRVVRVYNPTTAASSRIPIDIPELWSGSSSSSIAELKDELVRLSIAHRPFTLSVQHGCHWMTEESLSTRPAQEQLPAGPVVNARIEYPGFWSNVFFWVDSLLTSAFRPFVHVKHD